MSLRLDRNKKGESFMKNKGMTSWILMAISVVYLLGFVSGCGGSGDSDAKCKTVCERSAECGSTSTDCMERCQANPPSDACFECYQKETCSQLGSCYNSNCKGEDNQQGNLSEADCESICNKMVACNGKQTFDDCKQDCMGMTMVDECLDCPDISDCMDFWDCFRNSECWNP